MVISNLHMENKEFNEIHEFNFRKLKEIQKERPEGFFTSIKNFFLDLIDYREKKFNKAVETKDLTKIIQALKEGARPNLTDIDMSALMKAEKVDIVYFLLDYSSSNLFKYDAKNSDLKTIHQSDWVFKDVGVSDSDPQLRMKILDYILKYSDKFLPGIQTINDNIFNGLTANDFDATLREDIIKMEYNNSFKHYVSNVYFFSPLSPLYSFFNSAEIENIKQKQGQIPDIEQIAYALQIAKDSKEFLKLIDAENRSSTFYSIISWFASAVDSSKLNDSQKCYLINAKAKIRHKIFDKDMRDANSNLQKTQISKGVKDSLESEFRLNYDLIKNTDNFNKLIDLFDLIGKCSPDYLFENERLKKNPSEMIPILYLVYKNKINSSEIPESLFVEFINYARNRADLSDISISSKIKNCIDKPVARDNFMNLLAKDPSLLKSLIDNNCISADSMNDISNRIGQLILKENDPPSSVYELLKILIDHDFVENASIILFAAYFSENSKAIKQVELTCREKLSEIEKIHIGDNRIAKLLNVNPPVIPELVKKFIDAIHNGDPEYVQKHNNINMLKLESVDSPLNFKRYLEVIKNTKIVFDKDVYLKPSDLQGLF